MCLTIGSLALSGILATVVASSSASATPYLVGFELYKSAPDGTAINDPYFYSTNPNIGAAREGVTQGATTEFTSISFPLVNGNNTISFSPNGSYDPGLYAGVELFFNNTGTPYDPAGAGIIPDLAAFVPTAGGPITVPASGTNVIDYGNSFGAEVPYTGAANTTVDGEPVTITGLNIDRSPAGSMTITVGAVPEPASLSLLVLPLAGLARRRVRRG